jgi:hypothetical protein
VKVPDLIEKRIVKQFLKALGLEEERLRMCPTWKRHGSDAL